MRARQTDDSLASSHYKRKGQTTIQTSRLRNKHFRGVQGTFWTEHVNDNDLLEYLALPRLMAVAEAGWSPQSAKSFDSFVRRMQADTTLLDLGGYRYSPHYLKPAPPRPKKAEKKQ